LYSPVRALCPFAVLLLSPQYYLARRSRTPVTMHFWILCTYATFPGAVLASTFGCRAAQHFTHLLRGILLAHCDVFLPPVRVAHYCPSSYSPDNSLLLTPDVAPAFYLRFSSIPLLCGSGSFQFFVTFPFAFLRLPFLPTAFCAFCAVRLRSAFAFRLRFSGCTFGFTLLPSVFLLVHYQLLRSIGFFLRRTRTRTHTI